MTNEEKIVKKPIEDLQKIFDKKQGGNFTYCADESLFEAIQKLKDHIGETL